MPTALRICFVGDSITAGTGDPHCLGWPGRLCALENIRNGHDVTLYNLGIRADTSREIAQRWKSECGARLPSGTAGSLVFMFGVNDVAIEEGIGIRLGEERSITQAANIILRAKEWKPVLWIGPTPIREGGVILRSRPGVTYHYDHLRTEKLNRAYAVAAKEIGVPFLDLHKEFHGHPVWNACLAAGDGVHPTADGYELISDTVSEWKYWRDWLV